MAVLGAAVAYTLACPPHAWSALAWLVPGLLFVAVEGKSPARAFLCGLLFALGMGFGVTRWAFHASLEYFAFHRLAAGAFVACVWVVYGGLQYGGMLAAWAALARRVPTTLRAPLAGWLWVVMELGRALLFTGMPWELLGHTQFRALLLVQIADLGGVYAVSFVMALASVALAGLPRLLSRAPRRAVASLLAPAVALAATLVYGVRSRMAYDGEPAGDLRTIAVVQGNVPNAFRWKRAFFERTLAAYARLTRAATTTTTPDLVVWPENAVNFYLDRERLLRSQLGTVAGLAAEGLLVGGPRLDADGQARNSAYLLGRAGDVRATYDKQRLVPFAEYNPLPRLARGEPDGPVYRPGRRGRPMPADSMRLGTVICYEILFPGLVRDLVRQGADVLVNLSNDSWMDQGDGAAPQQHLSMAVFRAVETRRHLVRAAASGASAFVTPYGTLASLVPAGTAGSAVARVAARRELTPYVRWGELWVILAGGALGAALLRPRRTRGSP